MRAHTMASVLSTSGRMIHLCPNYTIPYEPHFRLLLVPFIPSALAPVRPDLKRNDLWRSLTFVTNRDISRYARECGRMVEFAPGMMLRSFERLRVDSIFRGRQKGIATIVFAILVRLHLLSFIGGCRIGSPHRCSLNAAGSPPNALMSATTGWFVALKDQHEMVRSFQKAQGLQRYSRT
jgi:hypothetical protein